MPIFRKGQLSELTCMDMSFRLRDPTSDKGILISVVLVWVFSVNQRALQCYKNMSSVVKAKTNCDQSKSNQIRVEHADRGFFYILSRQPCQPMLHLLKHRWSWNESFCNGLTELCRPCSLAWNCALVRKRSSPQKSKKSVLKNPFLKLQDRLRFWESEEESLAAAASWGASNWLEEDRVSHQARPGPRCLAVSGLTEFFLFCACWGTYYYAHPATNRTQASCLHRSQAYAAHCGFSNFSILWWSFCKMFLWRTSLPLRFNHPAGQPPR